RQKSDSIAADRTGYVAALYSHFDEINTRHFDGNLEHPRLEVRAFDKPNGGSEFLGFCLPATGHCLNGKIGIDSRTIDFCELSDKTTHANNVLLHEAVHLDFLMKPQNWCRLKITEQNMHGWAFSAACNRIGGYYNWKSVRSSRGFTKKKKRYALNCSSWPHNCQKNPAANADYIRVSRLILGARQEARKLAEKPSLHRDNFAIKNSFRSLFDNAVSEEMKAEVFELHRLLKMSGAIGFDL
ncbi:MAG: hypothetical protein WBM07_18150, partial [Chitinivibrionales bacterium]